MSSCDLLLLGWFVVMCGSAASRFWCPGDDVATLQSSHLARYILLLSTRIMCLEVVVRVAVTDGVLILES